jgi:hypothetical protein
VGTYRAPTRARSRGTQRTGLRFERGTRHHQPRSIPASKGPCDLEPTRNANWRVSRAAAPPAPQRQKTADKETHKGLGPLVGGWGWAWVLGEGPDAGLVNQNAPLPRKADAGALWWPGWPRCPRMQSTCASITRTTFLMSRPFWVLEHTYLAT